MSKEGCPPGKIYNKFLLSCTRLRPPTGQTKRRPPQPTAANPTYVSSRVGTAPWTSLAPSQAPSQAPWTSHVAGVWTAPPVGPYLWAAVAVVATGSILALVLWFLIYRQHRNRSNWTPPPALQITDKIDPLAGVHKPLVPGFYPLESIQKDPEPSCPHFDGGTYSTDLRHVNVTWVGETGSTGRKYRIPLPATEQGDTTLVTAKTGRDQYRPV